jgi:hypothetical protein
LSALLLGAHFLRHGMMPMVIAVLLVPLVLFFRRPWAARLVQVYLVLGMLEWIRTLLKIVRIRHMIGDAWVRVAVILGVVALFTGACALIFRSRALRERYRLIRTPS